MILMINPSFGEKSISYQKVIDVKIDSAEDVFSDINSYPQLFGNNVKSIDVISDNSAKMEVEISLCTFSTTFEHTKSGNTHTVNFISGDLEGSHLTATLSETWSFDGTNSAGGTIVDMDLYIADVPCVPDFTVEDELFTFILDKGLYDIQQYAKNPSEQIFHLAFPIDEIEEQVEPPKVELKVEKKTCFWFFCW